MVGVKQMDLMDYYERRSVFKYRDLVLLLILGMFCGGLAACDTFKGKKALPGPKGYDINKPIQIKLPLELDEISGVVYYAKDTSVMAINDEVGWLYKIPLNRPWSIQKWKFSDGADFEDLVLLDSVFYVLVSTGDIIAFKFITADSLYHQVYKFPLGGGNEFEILYYDDYFKKLILICKDCESDKKKFLSTYAFDPFTHQFTSEAFTIDVKHIAELLKEEKMKFKPSAAAINPVTGELYIISAVNKLIVVADRKGMAKEVYRVHKGLFKQPEGLSFSTNGTLIISNEAADIGVADILVFPRMTKDAKQ
jgi:hypothetical protein